MAVGKHSGGTGNTHQVSVEVLRGVGVVLGRCPLPHVHWQGSGLQVFEIRAGAVQGRNMERNQERTQQNSAFLLVKSSTNRGRTCGGQLVDGLMAF